jgi:hypothetical protein
MELMGVRALERAEVPLGRDTRHGFAYEQRGELDEKPQ